MWDLAATRVVVHRLAINAEERGELVGVHDLWIAGRCDDRSPIEPTGGHLQGRREPARERVDPRGEIGGLGIARRG